MEYNRNIAVLYALKFFGSLIPAYVIERLFFEIRGMTVQMVVFVEIIYAVTIVLLEIPTGIAADKWGRKKMMLLYAVMGCCEFLILLFSARFWHFTAVGVLAGIGNAAASGSENALLYDSLLQAGRQQQFEKHLGRLHAVEFAAIIIASLSGAFLAGKFGFELNYRISVVSSALALVAALLLSEPRVHGAGEEPIPIRKFLAESIAFFRANQGVVAVLLAGISSGAALNYLDEFWQIYLNRIHIGVSCFGLFITAMMLLQLPGSLLAHALKRKFSCRALLTAVCAVFTACFFCLFIIRSTAGIIAAFVIYLMSGLVDPLVSGYLHHRADSAMRATLDSFRSLALRAAVTMVGLGFGYFSDRFEIFGGFAFLAAVCVLFLAYLIPALKKIVS